jgi:hypothetical protein
VQTPGNKLMVDPEGGDGVGVTTTNRFAFNIRPQVTAEYQFFKRHSIGVS